MLKGDVIRLMCTLLATIIGEDKFKTSVIEFQEAAVEGAAFLDAMESQAKLLGTDAEVSEAWNPSDCEALFNLIAALQATQASECPIA